MGGDGDYFHFRDKRLTTLFLVCIKAYKRVSWDLSVNNLLTGVRGLRDSEAYSIIAARHR